ncbi:MAG: [FeFe] hydrogenase H-cluster maturation GTPase HydF [Desulfobacterota bacterium]|nr:[FeFe] hydrogenase H-cluster maturation GTPase HydF [Thermodesulfobacteriota bacterium]
MNTTPVANRLHIGIFGKRNAGKSSFINALTGQSVSIVSPVAGTTTDPVGKAMEIHGIGPVYIYDTAGIDDTGELGEKRVSRTRAVMGKINLAVVVTTAEDFDDRDRALLDELRDRGARAILVFNKIDVKPLDDDVAAGLEKDKIPFVAVSCLTGENIGAAREHMIELAKNLEAERSTIVGDIIGHGELVLLVVPIDLGAPKGRLILPQVQVIRDILDNDAVALVVKEREIEYILSSLKTPPGLVICDSQVVLKVAGDLPEGTKLTTFSILFSRLKGDLARFVEGVKAIDTLHDGDRVLICEACTHHPVPDDIGRVKIPRWVKLYTGKDITFDVHAGPILDREISDYKLIIHCGGCMINRAEMMGRIRATDEKQIPITNYGIAISHVHGVLSKALSPFPYEQSLLEEVHERPGP